MRVLTRLFLLLELTKIIFGSYNILEYVNDYLVYREANELLDDCGSEDLSICFKERILQYLEDVPNNINVGAGLKIIQNNASRNSRQHASTVFPDELRTKDDILDNLLLERLIDFIRSYSFEFKVPEETVNNLERSIEEGFGLYQYGAGSKYQLRTDEGQSLKLQYTDGIIYSTQDNFFSGRKKKGAMRMKPLLILLQIKAATLGAIVLKFIGLIAFKALLLAKAALTIASVIALKKLVETKHHSSTYEVHTHPLYDDHGVFGRSFHDDLAYRGH